MEGMMKRELKGLGDYLFLTVPGYVKSVVIKGGSLYIGTEYVNFRNLLSFLKYSPYTQFRVLFDLWAEDFPDLKARFKITYGLLNIVAGLRIFVEFAIEDGKQVGSVTTLFNSAGWLEREVWDMFGIVFVGHSDLRRILTDYGFEGYPLRKDFPLSGYTQVRYDEELKRVVLEPLELAQEYRYFDFVSPWEKEL